MIHVHKDFDAVPKSLQLTEEEYELLKEGKELDKSIYKADVLKALTEVYRGKCAYCESQLFFHESRKYERIDYYRPITHYFWLSHEWSNLQLVCVHCNLRHKNENSFPIKNELKRLNKPQDDIKEWRISSPSFLAEESLLINPEIDFPEEHLVVGMDGIIYPKEGSLKGLTTIEIVGLNRNSLVSDRRNIIEYVKKIESIEGKEAAIKAANTFIEKQSPFVLTYKSFIEDIEKCQPQIFAKKISIDKIRHLKDFSINICENNHRHLILTGKNGSGKTSLLEALKSFLTDIFEVKYVGGTPNNIFFIEKSVVRNRKNEGVFIEFNRMYGDIVNKYEKGNFVLAYFNSRRELQTQKVQNLADDLILPQKGRIDDNFSELLLGYLTHLRIDQSFSRDDGDDKRVKEIMNWFESFEQILKEIFEDNSLKLRFERKFGDYNFEIELENRDPFDFNTLADGYSSILKVVIELILRMQNSGTKNLYDVEGLVLIDEVDIHLHVDLQKEIMPLLTTFFPNIQFIVTTHSPFVLNSIDGAIVYDLENHHTFESSTTYSADGIIETHFQSDKYSEKVKIRLIEYKELLEKDKLTDHEKYEKNKLERYFKDVKSFISPELKFVLQDLQLKEIEKEFIKKSKAQNV